jgi:hypothetical protein
LYVITRTVDVGVSKWYLKMKCRRHSKHVVQPVSRVRETSAVYREPYGARECSVWEKCEVVIVRTGGVFHMQQLLVLYCVKAQ